MQRRSIKVDPVTRDIVILGGAIQIVTNINSVLQNCDNAMRQQLGELQYDQTKGIEYFGNVFNGTPNYQLFRFQAIQQLEAVDGVVRVLSFSYTAQGGLLSYSAEIQTDYGVGNVNGNV
jgi:hypothetical protein